MKSLFDMRVLEGLDLYASKTRVHDIVNLSREVKMDSSAGEEGSISKAARGLFFEVQIIGCCCV